MSEFQYYDFRALDRPLTQQERSELRAISSRAEITATSFTNEYEWGDLKADPAKLVERYFDAHFYLSNWGSRVLILKFPAAAVPRAALEPYALEDVLKVWSTKSHTLIRISCTIEDMGDFDEHWEDQGALAGLVPLRQQIMSGDYRSLYMAWLDGAVNNILNDRSQRRSITAPPIPPGLGTLDGALESFADVFWLDRDAIEIATRHSRPIKSMRGAKVQQALQSFIKGLDTQTKDAMLLRVARQEQGVGAELLTLFRNTQTTGDQTPAPPLSAIVQEVMQMRQAHARQEAERKRQEAEMSARAEAAKLEARRSDLRNNWEHYWQVVGGEIKRRNRVGYQGATKLIKALKDVATTESYQIDFTKRFDVICRMRERLPALSEELIKAGLVSV